MPTISGNLKTAALTDYEGFVTFTPDPVVARHGGAVVDGRPVRVAILGGNLEVELLPGRYLFGMAGTRPVLITVPVSGEHDINDLISGTSISIPVGTPGGWVYFATLEDMRAAVDIPLWAHVGDPPASYRYDADSTETDNGGSIIALDNFTGRMLYISG